jgi:cytochrome b561
MRRAAHRRHHPDVVARQLSWTLLITITLSVLGIFVLAGQAGWGCSTRLGAAWIATGLLFMAGGLSYPPPVRKLARASHRRLGTLAIAYVILHAICAVVHP